MEDFFRHNAFSIVGLLVTFATLMIHVGVSKGKLAQHETAITDMNGLGSQHGRMLAQRTEQLERQMIEARLELHANDREISDIRILLSAVTAKLDNIANALEQLAKRIP